MKIVFYKSSGGTWMDKLTSIVSFSKYSHCELVFSDGICASSSSRDDGVRFKQIDIYSGNWDIFELDSITPEVEECIRYYVNILVGDKYDYLGALGSVFGQDWMLSDKMYCSYFCSNVLQECRTITPGALYRTLVNKNLIKYNCNLHNL